MLQRVHQPEEPARARAGAEHQVARLADQDLLATYVLQWFNGKSDFASADVVHVGRGATVAGINATLKAVTSQTTTTTPPPPVAATVTKCHVPKLRGVKLKQAKKRLRAAHCRVGNVSRKRAKRTLVGRVVSSRPRARAVRPSGTPVALVVGRQR